MLYEMLQSFFKSKRKLILMLLVLRCRNWNVEETDSSLERSIHDFHQARHNCKMQFLLSFQLSHLISHNTEILRTNICIREQGNLQVSVFSRKWWNHILTQHKWKIFKTLQEGLSLSQRKDLKSLGNHVVGITEEAGFAGQRGGGLFCMTLLHGRLKSCYQLSVRPKPVFFPPFRCSACLLRSQCLWSIKSFLHLGTPKGSLEISPVVDLHSLLMTKSTVDFRIRRKSSFPSPLSFLTPDRSLPDFFFFFNLCYRTLIPLIFSVLILWYIAVMTFAFFLPSFAVFVFFKSVFWPGLVQSNEEKMFWGSHRPAIFCMVACIWINSFKSFCYFILPFY